MYLCLTLIITVTHILGETLGHYRDISSGVLVNGSLVIESVRQEDQGQYLCEAGNGIGEGLSSVVTLTVNGKTPSSYTVKCIVKVW